LNGFKEVVKRKYGIAIPKNDFADAVALAFTWTEFH
jgi:hypothetical protein